MTAPQDARNNVHFYRPKWWLLAVNVLSLAFLVFFLGMPLFGLLALFVALPGSGNSIPGYAAIFAGLMLPIILLVGLLTLYMLAVVIFWFFYTIKISPDGIEQNQFPFIHIRAGWADIERLGKVFIWRDVLYLRSFEKLGTSLSLLPVFKSFRHSQGTISLAYYNGWPRGSLEQDLRRYAPGLFEARQPAPAAPTGEATGPDQDTRLLVALSHASIVLSFAGAIFPLVIYIMHRRDSSYIRFQALQALVWQAVAFILNLLGLFCLGGSLLLLIFSAVFSSGNNSGWSSAVGVFAFLVMAGWIILSLLVNLGFVFYGIAGAVQAYQGKDFRYWLVGRLLDRSKS
jgi:uncharacterized Tic20 family protein